MEQRRQFAQTHCMLEIMHRENIHGHAVTHEQIAIHRAEDLIGHATTQDMVINSWADNLENHALTRKKIDQHRLEDFIGHATTHGKIDQHRVEDFIGHAKTREKIDQHRKEDFIGHATTQNMVRNSWADNLENHALTREIIYKHRVEDLIEHATIQDMIRNSDYLNAANFKMIQKIQLLSAEFNDNRFSDLSKQHSVIQNSLKALGNTFISGINNAINLINFDVDLTTRAINDNINNFNLTLTALNQIDDRIVQQHLWDQTERAIYFSQIDHLLEITRNATLDAIEASQDETRNHFRTVLESINKARIEPILSFLRTFIRYFLAESETLMKLPENRRIAKLEEMNGFLTHMKNSRTPMHSNSLHSLLFQIINQKHAVPLNDTDETAFNVLDLLLFGTQVYVAVMFFVHKQHKYLIDHYLKNNKLDKYNEYYLMMLNNFDDFKHSLTTNNKEGILDQTLKIVDDLAKNDAIKKLKASVIEAAQARLIELILTVDEADEDIHKWIFQTTPPKILKRLNFPENPLQTPIGQWMDHRKVRYALLLIHDDGISRLAEWSEPFVIYGKACPILEIPLIDAPQRNNTMRFVYR